MSEHTEECFREMDRGGSCVCPETGADLRAQNAKLQERVRELERYLNPLRHAADERDQATVRAEKSEANATHFRQCSERWFVDSKEWKARAEKAEKELEDNGTAWHQLLSLAKDRVERDSWKARAEAAEAKAERLNEQVETLLNCGSLQCPYEKKLYTERQAHEETKRKAAGREEDLSNRLRGVIRDGQTNFEIAEKAEKENHAKTRALMRRDEMLQAAEARCRELTEALREVQKDVARAAKNNVVWPDTLRAIEAALQPPNPGAEARCQRFERALNRILSADGWEQAYDIAKDALGGATEAKPEGRVYEGIAKITWPDANPKQEDGSNE